MTFNQAMDYINGFSKSGKPVTDLSRISVLLSKLGNPQNFLKFVHIAGTNGKGSTLELTSNALINAGFKTGQFTSPYIVCYRDRIRINNRYIPEEKVGNLCEIVKNSADGNDYSQFEITLAIALLYFMQEKCDIVFLETGVGGKLDATNVITAPLVSIITSVSFDHMAVLGDTLEKIASNKMGIIKPNVPCVLSSDNPHSVICTIKKYAQSQNSNLVIPDHDLCTVLNTSKSEFIYKNINYKLKMIGRHQINNALTAIEALNILRNNGFETTAENISAAFENVQIGARIEIISENPLTILDGSHNIAGISALCNTLSTIGKEKILVIGMIKAKDYKTCCEYINRNFDGEVVCVDGFTENTVSSAELSKYLDNAVFTADYINGLRYARKNAANMGKCVIICGSLYLSSAILTSQEI